MAPRETGDRESLLAARASKLRIDSAAVEVMQRFELWGVDARLLKGPSIAQWLYTAADHRPYLDCDLLVAPACLDRAEEILASLGYVRDFDARGMPSWWREHAAVWTRARDGLSVDLHHTLAGVGVGDHAAWGLLSANPAQVVVAGRQLLTLGLAARALHIAMHAAQHGSDRARSMADLHRALIVADDELWSAAAKLAGQLQAIDAFVAGLGLAPTGARLVHRLGLPETRSTDAALRASSPPPLALGFEQLARAHGMRSRLEIVVHKLVPPSAFVRHWDPRADDGRCALLRAYVRRPLWLLRRAPEGLKAWRQARRAVRAPKRGEQP